MSASCLSFLYTNNLNNYSNFAPVKQSTYQHLTCYTLLGLPPTVCTELFPGSINGTNILTNEAETYYITMSLNAYFRHVRKAKARS